MYKFINPGSSGISPSAQNEGARTTLLATNRLGTSVSGLAKTVNNLEKIYKASLKNEKLVEIAERKRAKRERDLAREEEIENQNLLNGKDLSKKAKEANSTKGKFGSKLVDSLLGGFQRVLSSIVGFLAKLFVLTELKNIENWFNDPVAQKKRKEFVDNLKYVFQTFAKFGKRLVVDGIAKPFDKLINGKTFGDKLQGLGKLVTGLAALTVLLNPFATMDAILSLMGMDFYRDRSQEKGDSKNKTRDTKTRTKNKFKKLTTKQNTQLKQYGKNGKNAYNRFRADGATHKEALTKVKRLQRAKPNLFKPKVQVPSSGLSPSGAPTGIATKYGAKRLMGRGALKFMGKANVKLLGKAFQNTFGRIPIFGSILTAVFSILSGDPWKQTLFKTAGAGVGGALGSFIPIPGVGTFIGMTLGEYVGDLLYTGFSGKPDGGWKKVGEKLKGDVMAVLGQLGKMMTYIKNSFARYYKGIPKIKIPDFPKDPPNWIPKFTPRRNAIWKGAKIAMKAMMPGIGMMMGKEIPNVLWMANPMNNVKLLHQAFFKPFENTPDGGTESGAAMTGVKGVESESGDSTSGTSGSTGGTGDTGGTSGTGAKGLGDPNYVGNYGQPTNKNERGDAARRNREKKKAEETIKQNKGSSYDLMPFLSNFNYKGVESDNERYGDTVPDGSFGIGSKSTDKVSRHSVGSSKDQPKAKKPWWRFGFEEGGEYPQYLFGFVKSIFKGVTNVVKGVVNTVSSVVSSVAQVAMPILSVAAPFIPALAPLMPFMQAANAFSALQSGNIMGAISGGLGALGGFFPGTFGAESAFGTFMSSNPIGRGISGFMSGGIQGAIGGALGGLSGILPQGFQNFLGGIQGFMGKFPSIGGILNGIPGLGNVLGAFGISGGGGGAGFSPISLFGDIANNMGFGSIFKTVTGMLQGGGMGAVMDGLREMAPELGVLPEALGVFVNKNQNVKSTALSSRQNEMSKAYAMQSQLEFVPMPVIIEKLVPIHKAIPVGGQ